MSFALVSQTTRMAVSHSRRCCACCRACSSCKSFASKLPATANSCVWLYRQGTCLPSAALSMPGPCPCSTIRFSTCWRALGLLAVAADEDFTNAMTLDCFRVQQQKVTTFASGMHSRLGAASGVSWLDEQALVRIADEVLGVWGLLKEWRQELVAAKV